MTIEELQKHIKALPKDILQYLILTLMIDNSLSFKDLSESYVAYLENCNKKKQKTIIGLANPLSYYWTAYKGKKKMDIFIKCKSAYNLLASNVFHTAKIENEFIKFLEKYPYDEDKNGYPSLKNNLK